MSFLPYLGQEPCLQYKLSRVHRRVFPLSLFPSPSPNSPMNSIRVSPEEDLPRTLSRLRGKKKIERAVPRKAKSTKNSVPPLKIKELMQTPHRALENRFYYKPNQISLSPRSKVTIYTVGSFYMDIGNKNIENKAHKMHQRVTRGKLHKRNITEFTESPKGEIKLSRVTSSKILFPATTTGQIIIKIKDLVLDPLRKEMTSHKYK